MEHGTLIHHIGVKCHAIFPPGCKIFSGRTDFPATGVVWSCARCRHRGCRDAGGVCSIVQIVSVRGHAAVEHRLCRRFTPWRFRPAGFSRTPPPDYVLFFSQCRGPCRILSPVGQSFSHREGRWRPPRLMVRLTCTASNSTTDCSTFVRYETCARTKEGGIIHLRIG